MKLTELAPQYDASDSSMSFHCPICRRGVISVSLKWATPEAPRHGADSIPPNFETLTINPSIAAENRCSRQNRGCPGWHGHITNGEVS